MRTPHLFCFGLGYSALALAERLAAQGWRVSGTCRTEEKRCALAARGIGAYPFDRGRLLDRDGLAALGEATHLLLSIPPEADIDPVLDAHAGVIGARRELGRGLNWVGYLSTTGVYGDQGGAWVDEATPTAPITGRGRARLAAETGWLDLWRRLGVPVHLFRLPGIYGPGRSAIDALRAGTAKRIDKPGQVFSRIHADDIAGALMASMERPNPGAAYNVADDGPAPSHEVIAFAAGLLGMEPPPLIPFAEAGLSPMAASFYGESKRVANRRLKEELGYRLRYPTYREGLAAQFAAETSGKPFSVPPSDG